ncbi:MAG: hypothetical protein U0324_36370 [Polyangiales bacterium]
MKRWNVSAGVACVVASACVGPGEGDPLETGTGDLSVLSSSGTIQFYGCAPRAGDVRLVASPVRPTLRAPREGEATARRDAPTGPSLVPGVALPTRDVHLLRFTFPALRAGAYQLLVRVDAQRCPDVRWRGPTGGAFLAGQHDLRLEALVPRTRLGVVRPGGRAAYAADAAPIDALRELEVTPTLPDVVDYELVATTERPRHEAPSRCAEPGGVLFRQPLTLRPGVTARVPFSVGRALAASGGDARGRVTPREEYLRGRPLYLQVRPARSTCNAADDGVGAFVVLLNPALLAAAGLIPPSRVTFTGTYQPGSAAPRFPTTPTTVAFEVVRPHVLPPRAFVSYAVDPLGAMLVFGDAAAPGTTLQPGTIFYYTPSSGGGGGGLFDSVTDAFGDVVSGVVDSVAWVVNKASQTYEEIQQRVVTAVASALDALPGVSCDATCRAGITLAMKTGMVAMGVPPSLPNFDELMDQGVDYLAAAAAEEAGIPPEVAQAAVHAAVDQLKANRGVGAPGTATDWVVPASVALPERTLLTLTVPSGNLAGRGTLAIRSNPYLDAALPVPATPGTWNIPIVHERELEGIPGPQATVDTVFGPVALSYAPAYLDGWYFTRWRANHPVGTCTLSTYGLYDSDGSFRAGALSLVRLGTAATWSSPSAQNQCM